MRYAARRMADQSAADLLVQLDPIPSRRVSDVVADQLARAIRDGTLKPGDRLPTEQALAHELRVGRTSVREGLGKLRAYGLIESRKGQGAYVTTHPTHDPLADFARWTATNPTTIQRLLEARIALETLAAGLAAIRITDPAITELHHLNNNHAAATDPHTLTATDTAFHDAIMHASANPYLHRLYDALIIELADFRRKTLALPWAAQRSATSHTTIIHAITHHNPTQARTAMTNHLYTLYTEITTTTPNQPAPRQALA